MSTQGPKSVNFREITDNALSERLKQSLLDPSLLHELFSRPSCEPVQRQWLQKYFLDKSALTASKLDISKLASFPQKGPLLALLIISQHTLGLKIEPKSMRRLQLKSLSAGPSMSYYFLCKMQLASDKERKGLVACLHRDLGKHRDAIQLKALWYLSGLLMMPAYRSMALNELLRNFQSISRNVQQEASRIICYNQFWLGRNDYQRVLSSVDKLLGTSTNTSIMVALKLLTIIPVEYIADDETSLRLRRIAGALSHEDPMVPFQAISALKHLIKNPENQAFVLEQLKMILQNKSNFRLKERAAETLGEMAEVLKKEHHHNAYSYLYHALNDKCDYFMASEVQSACINSMCQFFPLVKQVYLQKTGECFRTLSNSFSGGVGAAATRALGVLADYNINLELVCTQLPPTNEFCATITEELSGATSLRMRPSKSRYG